MQKNSCTALQKAIERLEEVINGAGKLSRMEKNRFNSLVEKAKNDDGLLAMSFISLYHRCAQAGLVWSSQSLRDWEKREKVEVNTTTPVFTHTTEGNLNMIRSPEGVILSYEIISGKSVVNISREEAEKMLLVYAGNTLDSLANLYPEYSKEQLRAVLKALGGNKESVAPPHILEELSCDEIAQYTIRAKKAGAMHKYRNNMVVNLDRALKEQIKKTAELENSREFIQQVVGDATTLFTEARNTVKIASQPNPYVVGGTYWFCISDLHIGKKDILPDGAENSISVIRKKMKYVLDKILFELRGVNPEKIKILILGDILETAMFAGMHGEQFKKIEKFGADQIVEAVDILEEFILSVSKTYEKSAVTVDIISGNHDRLADDRADDVWRTGGQLVFSFLNKIIKEKNTTIEYHRDGVISINDDGLNVIGFHGDNALIKRKGEEIHAVFAKDKNHHSLILNGHYHSFESKENHQFTKIQLGSVCSNDKYELYQLGVRNTPSFLIVKNEIGVGVEWKKIPIPEKFQ